MSVSKNQLLYVLLVILPLVFLSLDVLQTMKEVRCVLAIGSVFFLSVRRLFAAIKQRNNDALLTFTLDVYTCLSLSRVLSLICGLKGKRYVCDLDGGLGLPPADDRSAGVAVWQRT
jgi:hypothetical protein